MNDKNEKLARLKYPENRFQLALLSISAFQFWYRAQSPMEMIFLGQNAKFKSFMRIYLMKLAVLRFWYKIRRVFDFNNSGFLAGKSLI